MEPNYLAFDGERLPTRAMHRRCVLQPAVVRGSRRALRSIAVGNVTTEIWAPPFYWAASTQNGRVWLHPAIQYAAI